MTQLPKRIAKKLLLLAVCCIAAGVFFFTPVSKVGGHNVAAASTSSCYWGTAYTYYSDASLWDEVGYRSCLGSYGTTSPYYTTERVVCGGCPQP